MLHNTCFNSFELNKRSHNDIIQLKEFNIIDQDQIC